MVQKSLIALLVIAAIAVAFYLSYLWNKPNNSEMTQEQENEQPAPVIKPFQGPTSSPSGIKGPSGPPPGQN